MAKSGQKRAFEDETVQDTLPKEELSVHGRSVLDLSSSIDAELNRTGLFFNPQVWNDLADISKDVHDTRRNKANLDFSVGYTGAKNNITELAAIQERDTKRMQDIELTGYKTRFAADAESILERARRGDTEAIPLLQNLNYEAEKQAAALDKVSPYMGEQFRTFASNKMVTSFTRGVEADSKLMETKAKYEMLKSASVQIGNVGTNTLPVDDALLEYANTTFGQLDSVQDSNAIVNDHFNAVVLADARAIKNKVRSGEITAEQGSNLILSDLAKYQRYSLKSEALGADNKTVDCFLTENVYKEMQSIAGSLKENANKAQSVYTLQGYDNMTGYDSLSKGDYLNNPYLIGASPDTAAGDYAQAAMILFTEMGKGNEAAAKQFYELSEHYFRGVRPVIFFKGYFSKILAEKGNIGDAMVDVKTRLTALKARLENRNDDLSNVPELAFSNGNIFMNIGIPQAGIDNNLDGYYRRPGQTEYQARFNYYSDIVNNAQKFLDKVTTADMLTMLNPNYAVATEQAMNMLSYENLVREDAQNGIVAPNTEGSANAVKFLNEASVYKQAAAGTTFVSSQSGQYLEYFARIGNSKNLKQKAMYYQAVADTLTQAGETDMFTSYKLSALPAAQQEAAKIIAMWGYFNKSPELKAVGDLILKSQVGGANTNPSIDQANTLLRDKLKNAEGDGTLGDTIQSYMNKHKIPAEYQPTVRYALTQMAVAKVTDPDNPDAEFDAKDFNKLLDANFTSRGTYKFSKALQGKSPDEVDALIDKSEKEIQKGLKNMGVEKSIEARLDSETGTIKFYSGGREILGIGNYGPLQGTGMTPFSVKVTGKPANVSQDNYDNATSSLLQGVVMTTATSNASTNSKITNHLNKNKYTGAKVKDIESASIRLQNAMLNTSNQAEWVNYVNSGYTSTQVPAMPKEQKDAFKSIFADSSFGFVVSSMSPAELDKLQRGSGIGKAIPVAPSAELDRFDRMLDFFWAKSQTPNKVSTDMPKSMYYASNGVPYINMLNEVERTGWHVTSTTEGQHEQDSLHYTGMAMDIGGKNSFSEMLDKWGKLDVKKLDNLIENFVKPNIEAGNIRRIITSRKEFWSDPAYAKYRSMKNSKGEKLFDTYPGHDDHLHISFYQTIVDPKTNKPYGWTREEYIGNASHLIMTNVNGKFGFLTPGEAKALPTVFTYYKPSAWDMKNAGLSEAALKQSPLMNQLAGAAKYVSGKNALGSANLTIAGMKGAKFNVQIIGLEPGVKQPSRIFTLEQAIDFSRKRPAGTKLSWSISGDASAYNKYLDMFVKASR